MQRILSKLTIFLLKSKRLSGDDRTEVMNALLDNLVAVQTKDIVSFDEQGLLSIGGRKMDMDKIGDFIMSARAYQENPVRRVIRDQVMYEATKLGVHNGLNPETIQFAKAAIWWGQQEDLILQSIITR